MNLEGFQKGHPRYGGMKKDQKTYKTIQKDKAREAFDEAQLKRWLKISDNLAKRAETDQKTAEYAVNQVIGKPKETIGLEGELKHRIVSIDE